MNVAPCATQLVLVYLFYTESVHLLIPNSQFTPLPSLPFGNHKLVFYVSGSILSYNKFICIIFLVSIYKWYHMIFVFHCLTSLSMIISGSIHVATNGIISFFYGWVLFHCTYIPHFIHSSVCGHLCFFHVLAIINRAGINIGVRDLFELEFSSFLDICPGVGLLDHIVSPFLVFLRTLHTIFHSGCIDLPSHQEHRRVSFSSHPLWDANL